jgi:hypothetical protein
MYRKSKAYQSDNEGYKTPVIEFSTTSGEEITEKPLFYVSSDLSKIRSYKDKFDQPVSVLYDPDNPKKFILISERKLSYLFLTVLFIFGLVFIVVSIGSFFGFIDLS